MPATPATTADIALLLVYGAVAFFFLWRFARHRKPPSVGIALLSLGWVFFSLWHLELLRPDWFGWLQWFGVVAGVYLLVAVVRAERTDSDP